MNPIISTGLISLGQNLLDRVIPPRLQSVILHGGIKEFSSLLNDQETTPTAELSAYLAANGINGLSNLQNHLFKLTRQLSNDPALAAITDPRQEVSLLTLRVESGNRFSVVAPDGTKVYLPANSTAGKIAWRIHQLQSLQQNISDRPGIPVTTLADRVAVNPILNAVWNLT